jgi:ribonucleoside-triphosphate reductase (thioredoxin)
MSVYNSLPTQYQQFVHLSRYAKWITAEGRRETWPETVNRYITYMCDVQCKDLIPTDIRQRLQDAITNLEVMPSMRALMTAGPALARDEVAAYNCSTLVLDDIAAFDEALYLLMVGAGVGYSVERQFITKLPVVADRLRPSKTVIKVEDSRIGWANALRELISMLYQGRIPEWDTSAIRPKGARLITFGGRASGPGPLDELFRFVVSKFNQACGRKLNSLECHDIMCKIADAVVAGGVRRSALLSLSNPSDDRMRHAKAGNWWETEPQRALANISACYTEKPGMDVFMREWLALYDSKSGERGIFNRQAAVAQAAKNGRRDTNHEFITNPCSEIIARPCGLCNLTEAVVRADDTLATLKDKVELATIMGTMQATLTNFRYLREEWKQNAEEERLLGVSLTGIMDNDLMGGRQGKRELKDALTELREHAIAVNKQWAAILGIKQATALSAVKPSGTVSQLVNSSSGIHPRYAHYYIRTIRAHKTDPLARMMVELGFPVEDDVTKPDQTWVSSFPVKSPDNAVTHQEFTSIDQLELWKVYQSHWCEHKVSMTVHVNENEWMKVGAWVYDNFDIISGIAFLPATTHNYRQAPYQECTEADYQTAMAKMPKLDWSRLREYEDDDEFSSRNAREFACTANACELVDLTP